MPDHFSKRDLGYLTDILIPARDAQEYTGVVNREQFLEEGLTTSAVMYCLLIIGEAVKNISDEVKTDISGVDWGAIARFRDLGIHHYRRTDFREVWDIVHRDLPQVISIIEPLVPSEENH